MEPDVEPLQAYLERHLPERGDVLRGLELAAQEEGIPIVGPHVGALLMVLTRASGTKRALELGTAIGYSAIWIARGLMPSGRLITVEKREEMAKRAEKSIAEAGLGDSVEIRVGEALGLLPSLGEEFDMIFNDVDKEGYPKLLPVCKKALRPGGLLVTDNVLWGGRVASQDDSPTTKAIREYNRLLAEDEEMPTVILPLRDGVSISVKSV